jgi:hypothetical protein
MADQDTHFEWVNKVALAAMIAGLALVALGLVFTITDYALNGLDSGIWYQPMALWLIVALLAAVPTLLVAYGIVRVVVANERALQQTTGRLARIETFADDTAISARDLVDIAGLSDQAKSLIYRDRELTAVREAIQEDLMRQDYDTAVALADGVETKFGYLDEARRLREQIEETRRATTEEKIEGAIKRIQEMVKQDNWVPALRAAHKLVAVFPDHPKAQALPTKIETERARQKRELLQRYGEAVSKNDVDQGVELLRQLDKYLTPQEAAALQESARGVFRAKLHNLGVQFAIHVTDQAWSAAVTTGEEIVRNYPNSRMAHEVRQKMDQLKARAAAAEQPASS